MLWQQTMFFTTFLTLCLHGATLASPMPMSEKSVSGTSYDPATWQVQDLSPGQHLMLPEHPEEVKEGTESDSDSPPPTVKVATPYPFVRPSVEYAKGRRTHVASLNNLTVQISEWLPQGNAATIEQTYAQRVLQCRFAMLAAAYRLGYIPELGFYKLEGGDTNDHRIFAETVEQLNTLHESAIKRDKSNHKFADWTDPIRIPSKKKEKHNFVSKVTSFLLGPHFDSSNVEHHTKDLQSIMDYSKKKLKIEFGEHKGVKRKDSPLNDGGNEISSSSINSSRERHLKID